MTLSACTDFRDPAPRTAGGAAGLRQRLIRDADACVACGMCLPVCPTYVDTRDEAESARGRIALVRAVAEQRLEPGPQLVSHLEHCLQCQACEQICPAGVRYGSLMDGAYALLRESGAGPRWPLVARALPWLSRSRPRLYVFGWLLALYRFSGVQRLARRSGLLRWLGLEGADRFARVQGVRFGWRRSYAAHGAERGRVGLFTGCVANLVDRDNLQAAIAALRAVGYRVEVPPGQRCCGAMDLHAGREAAHAAARRRNVRAFEAAGVETVVYIASGCGAVLGKYGATGSQKSLRMVDINRFLLEASGERALDADHCADSDSRTFLHVPCSMRNATHEQDAPAQLLRRAGVEFATAPKDDYCCGAAGTYSLRHPVVAQRLGRQVLRQARAQGCDVIATCNVGCAMHLAALAQEEGIAMSVIHPVQRVASGMGKRDEH